jgi:hypothetical protein
MNEFSWLKPVIAVWFLLFMWFVVLNGSPSVEEDCYTHKGGSC